MQHADFTFFLTGGDTSPLVLKRWSVVMLYYTWITLLVAFFGQGPDSVCRVTEDSRPQCTRTSCVLAHG